MIDTTDRGLDSAHSPLSPAGPPGDGREGTRPGAVRPLPARLYALFSGMAAAGLRLALGRIVAGRYAAVRERLRAERGIVSPAVDEALLVALMCAEDHRSPYHAGVDVLSVCRAVWRTAFLGRPEGASTIEQQCVRVVGGDHRRRLARKLAEMAMACLLARDFDKRTIARHYLRHAYFGSGMHGLAQALARLGLEPGRLDQTQAIRLVARLKYPQPWEPDAAYATRIAARERHIGRLCDRYGATILAALPPQPALSTSPGFLVPGATQPAPGLGVLPGEAAGDFVGRGAVDWSLVRFFQPREWGNDPARVDPDIVYRLDRARRLVGRPCMIHAAYAVSGHEPRSYHYLGRAVDFHFGPDGGADEELEALLAAGFTGIGYYPNWSPRPGWHADNRPRPLFWMRQRGVYRRFASARALCEAMRGGRDTGDGPPRGLAGPGGGAGCRSGADMFYGR